MAQKVPQDTKKEEFKKYLDKAGVLDLLTKSLVQLYEEPQKPTDALGYLKKSVAGNEDKLTIETLRTENEELKRKIAELESSQAALQAKVTALEEAAAAANSGGGNVEAPPVAAADGDKATPSDEPEKETVPAEDSAEAQE